jgi:Subtilase family.
MNLKFAACLLAVALIAPFVPLVPLAPLAPLVSGWGGREGNPELYSVYRGLREFGVEDAWKMGYTGEGVKVAVIDSGIDFATPDLIGTQARVENETSPYHGWPIVIDLKSLSSYQSNSFGYYSQYADTSSTDTEGYTLTGTSKGGVYHIGNHSDQHLTNYYREPVKVLVVDEQVSGV